MTEMHLIYSNHEGYGWSLRSPQLPGLAAGRNTIEELLRDTSFILRFAQSEITDIHDERIHLHEEHVLESPDGTEYLIRWMTSGDDGLVDDRVDAASRLQGSVLRGLEGSIMRRQPVLPTGERLLIAVAGTDTIAMFADQLGRGGCAVLSKHEGEDLLISIPFADGELEIDGQRWGTDALNLERTSTFDDMASRVIGAEASTLHAPLDSNFTSDLTSA